MLKLIIEDDEGRKTVVPFAREEMTIGRQEGNTIRLTERNVSRRHARLLRQNGHVVVEDLGSSNGIRVNGDRIAGQVQVQDGDLIQIGDYDLALESEEAATIPLEPTHASPVHNAPAPAPAPAPTQASATTLPFLPPVGPPHASDDDVDEVDEVDEPDEAAPSSDASSDGDVVELGAPASKAHESTAVIRIDQVDGSHRRRVVQIDPKDAPRLVVLTTEHVGREFACLRSEMRIGRTDDNDIALDHRSLSRTHCKIVREENGEWRVIDLQSANGLLVNGEPYAQVTLRFGDILELGHVKFKFVSSDEPVTLSGAPSLSQVPRERRAGASKVPVVAVLAALLVLVFGGGGYWVWKNRVYSKTRLSDVGPAVRPAAPDPEAQRRAAEAAIAQAKEAAQRGEFDTAIDLLQKTQVDGAAHPEARSLLAQLEAEQIYKAALVLATQALKEKDPVKAQAELDRAAQTTLLRTRYLALVDERAQLEKQLVEATAAKPPPQLPPPPKSKIEVAPNAAAVEKPLLPPLVVPNAEAEALFEEARALFAGNAWEAAANRLERCITVSPMFDPCYRALGSTYASLGKRDKSETYNEKALKYYRRYLEMVPSSDPHAAKIKKILDRYAADTAPNSP